MKSDRKIAPNVWEFIHKASSHVARLEDLRFSMEMQNNCLEQEMDSPIEQLFWIAMHVMCKVVYVGINPGPDIDANGKPYLLDGVYLGQQVKVGKYRVDFVASYEGHFKVAPIIIELDGHAFHDKDKKQRAYEKSRDRELTRQGYRVLHFTGSEIVADPLKVAHEVLEMLELAADPYDASNPTGLE